MHMPKSSIECYRYAKNGEWATIAVSENWFYDKTQHHGEILVHSSYGNFCNSWINTGIPFKKFLIKMDMEAFGRKTMGLNDTVIDCERTRHELINQLFIYRRDHEVDKYHCRVIYDDITRATWDDVNEYYSWFYSFVVEYEYDCPQFGMDSPDDFLVDKPNPQLVGFWNELWSLFANELKEELTWQKTQNLGA